MAHCSLILRRCGIMSKKLLLTAGFVLFAISICHSQDANQNHAVQDSVLKVHVDAQYRLSDPSKLSEIVSLNNEYYVFTDRKYVQIEADPAIQGGLLKHVEDEAKRGSQFYNKTSFTPSTVKTGVSLSSAPIIGFAKGNFLRAKYGLGTANETKQFFYLCKPQVPSSKDYRAPELVGDSLSEDTKIQLDARREEVDDSTQVKNVYTLFVSYQDAHIQGLKIFKPKYSRFESVTLKKDTLFTKQELPEGDSFLNILYSDTTNLKSIPLDLSFSELSSGDTLAIHYSQMGESGIVDEPYSIRLVVKKIEEERHPSLAWLWILLGILLLAGIGWLYLRRRMMKLHSPRKVGQDMPEGDNAKDTSIKETPVSDPQPVLSTDKVEEPGDDSLNQKDVSSEVPPSEDLGSDTTSLNLKDVKEELDSWEKKYNDIIRENESLRNSLNDLVTKLAGFVTRNDLDEAITQGVSPYKEKIQQCEEAVGQIGQVQSSVSSLQEKVVSMEDAISTMNDTFVTSFKQSADDLKGNYSEGVDSLKTVFEECVGNMQQFFNETVDDLQKKHSSALMAEQKKQESIQSAYNAETEARKQDRAYIVSFFTKLIDQLDGQLDGIVRHSDSGSSAHYQITELISSVNGYAEFREKGLAEIRSDRPLESVEQNLLDLFVHDLEYERSWINDLARLRSYSLVDSLHPIFGYYVSAREEFEDAYASLRNLGVLLGVSDITVPKLFVDVYDMDKFDFENSSLVLPELFPGYTTLFGPALVYDLYRVGYTSGEKTVKPTVAYFPNI